MRVAVGRRGPDTASEDGEVCPLRLQSKPPTALTESTAHDEKRTKSSSALANTRFRLAAQVPMMLVRRLDVLLVLLRLGHLLLSLQGRRS
jgi:hypothetical protein